MKKQIKLINQGKFVIKELHTKNKAFFSKKDVLRIVQWIRCSQWLR